MSDEEPSFVIRDRRGRSDSTREESPVSPTPRPSADTSGDAPHAGPPVTFSSFVFSLGTSSLMLMGETLDPQQPAMEVNLPQAKEMIDILSMLEEKTKNNLSTEEASVLRDMLYTLRMKFVSLSPGKGKAASF
ncbi:MAG: DUF1844 domain-containing protein [Nitrospirales bacterium]|nr:DUF1844 domain-containing protein [Nitrospirales bacterium]